MSHLLIPPDVSQPNLARRTVVPDVKITRSCPDGAASLLRQPARRSRVIVTRDELINRPDGYLSVLASEWEDKGCVAPGDGRRLATAIAEALPLEPTVAFRLLYDRRSAGVDLDGQTRLEVVSPLRRDPALGILEGPIGVTESDSGLTLTAKSVDDLIGYEKTLYELQSKMGQRGYKILPVSSVLHTLAGGADEHKANPSTNYFEFPREAAFYRLFYESWRNDFSAMVIAAPTPAELDRLTAKFESRGASASCEDLQTRMCVQIPKDVAVNPSVAITVNQAQMLVTRGATLRQVLVMAKAGNPDTAVPRISVLKSWRGRRIPVSFDRTDPEILSLPMYGGEIISWH
jgi:hypothetical protein